MDDISDQFPELPVPINSRAIALGFQEVSTKEILKKVVWLRQMDDATLADVALRFVLSTKLLNGLTLIQLQEALNGTDLRIYFDIGDNSE